MYKKGDKFVIEIGDVLENENGEAVLYRIEGFKSLVFDKFGLDKLEMLVDGVNKFSENKGFAKGFVAGHEDGVNEERNRIKAKLNTIISE